MSEDLKVYTFDEVSTHDSVDDLWIVYDGKVYDVTKYVDEHPGGEEVVVDCAGTDATEAFNDIGHSEEAHKILSGLLIGRVEGGSTLKPKKTAAVGQEQGGVSTPLLAAVVALLAIAAYFFFVK